MFAILFLSFLIIDFGEPTIKELNSVKLSELGLRNVCPFDEFSVQFNSIKHEFKSCLHFKHILFDVDFKNILNPPAKLDQDALEDLEEEQEIQKHFTSISYSKNKLLNPFCKLSKHWNDCTKYALSLNCLEPNAKSLVPAFLPRTVHEQLRRLYDMHAKQLKMIQKVDLDKFPHSGDRKVLEQEEETILRENHYIQIRKLKFEQLADYFKFRCNHRAQLHIDSLDLDVPKNAPPIDRLQQEAFADIF